MCSCNFGHFRRFFKKLISVPQTIKFQATFFASFNTHYTFSDCSYLSPPEIIGNLSKNRSSNQHSKCLYRYCILHFFGVITDVIELKIEFPSKQDWWVSGYLHLYRFKLVFQNRSASGSILQGIVLMAPVDNSVVTTNYSRIGTWKIIRYAGFPPG